MTTTSNATSNEKLEGLVGSYNPAKTCGVLFTRNNVTMAVEKYFFHIARLIISEVDITNIQVGMFVRFRASEVPPSPGNFRHAIDVELFVQNPTLVGATNALAGAQ
ncbi:MAG TPA: hypothetical protein VN982_01665 [Candidatus Dormibacteraeota bacterium]|nr:hypothetical protein [Candidatus Dormibacteraeota bacterium]